MLMLRFHVCAVPVATGCRLISRGKEPACAHDPPLRLFHAADRTVMIGGDDDREQQQEQQEQNRVDPATDPDATE